MLAERTPAARLIQSEAAVSPGIRRISVERAPAERALRLIRSEVTVRSVHSAQLGSSFGDFFDFHVAHYTPLRLG
jgi:hypothetical protein